LSEVLPTSAIQWYWSQLQVSEEPPKSIFFFFNKALDLKFSIENDQKNKVTRSFFLFKQVHEMSEFSLLLLPSIDG